MQASHSIHPWEAYNRVREQNRSKAIRKQLSDKLYASDTTRRFSEGGEANVLIAISMNKGHLWLSLEMIWSEKTEQSDYSKKFLSLVRNGRPHVYHLPSLNLTPLPEPSGVSGHCIVPSTTGLPDWLALAVTLVKNKIKHKNQGLRHGSVVKHSPCMYKNLGS